MPDAPAPAVADIARSGRRALPLWLAPLVGIVRPKASARRLAVASPAQLGWITAALAAIGALLVVALALFQATGEQWVTASTPAGPEFVYVDRSLVEVWRAWHADSWFGPTEQIFLVAWLILVAIVPVTAWTQTPYIHRDGALADAFRRGCCAAVPGCSLMVLLGGAVAARLIWLFKTSFSPPPPPLTLTAGLPLTLWLSCVWIERATAAVRCRRATPYAVVCEGCGYDISRPGPERRCPECGLDVDASLGPGAGRRGTPWEHWCETARRKRAGWSWAEVRLGAKTLRAGALTTFLLLVAPAATYRRMPVRTGLNRAWWFSVFTFCAVSVLGGAYTLALFRHLAGQGRPVTDVEEAYFLALVALLWWPLLMWGAWRGLASLLVTPWMLRRSVQDTGYLAKAVAYESVFVWPFCLWVGGLLTSFALFGDWIGELLDPVVPAWAISQNLGLPPEPAVLFAGCALLGVLWVRRYFIAVQAVRWSNT